MTTLVPTSAKPMRHAPARIAAPAGAAPAPAHVAPTRGRRRRSPGLVLRDERGATAMVFAGVALALFGFAALATEDRS